MKKSMLKANTSVAKQERAQKAMKHNRARSEFMTHCKECESCALKLQLATSGDVNPEEVLKRVLEAALKGRLSVASPQADVGRHLFERLFGGQQDEQDEDQNHRFVHEQPNSVQ